MVRSNRVEHISNFNMKFKKKSEKALMTEVSKMKIEFEKNLQNENVSKIKQLEMENESLKSKLDHFIQLVPSLVAKEEVQRLLVENSNLKGQLTNSHMENFVLKENIQKMKFNEIALEEQLVKLKKAERIPCSICRKLCNSEKSLQRHIIDKHLRDNDF